MKNNFENGGKISEDSTQAEAVFEEAASEKLSSDEVDGAVAKDAFAETDGIKAGSPKTAGESESIKKEEEASADSEAGAPQTRKRKRRPLKKFSEMTKKEKGVRVLNFSIGFAFSITSLVLFLITVITGHDPDNRLMSYFGGIILFLVPQLLELIFRVRLNNFVQILFYVYMVIAYFGGCILNLYNVWGDIYFDKIVHFAAGYVFSMLGLFIVCKLADYKKLHPVFIVLVCFAVTMASAAIWELLEYFADHVLGQTAQGVPVVTVDGKSVVSLTDTMQDMLCNFLGGIGFVVHYVIHKLTKKNLLIDTFVKGFEA